jgi:uncharacterized protein YcgL (UPF0745 family)
MRRRIRFSISALLAFVTALTIFLGYSQYRRGEILKVCAELQAEGYFFQVPDTWHDRLWQRKPVVGTVFKVNEKERMSRSRRLHEGGTLRSPTGDEQEIERFKQLGMVKYRALTRRQERDAKQLDEIRERLKRRGYEE